MAVRRLAPEQPSSFEFTPENLAWAKATIAKYPAGKQASAIIPLLWRAQEQHDGWLPEPALRYVSDMLDMPYIRAYEVATFYTMFQLGPVGKVAHVQVCGTTPCMLRGAEDIKAVCKRRIHDQAHHVSADGRFSWEEVECLGSCANAPMVQIWKDTYEDLTPELFEKVLDGFANGTPPKPGSQIGRQASSPLGERTTLTDPSILERGGKFKPAGAEVAGAATQGSGAGSAAAAIGDRVKSAAAGVAAATAGLASNLPGLGRSSSAAAAKAGEPATGQGAAKGAPGSPAPQVPALLDAPRDGKGDELELIWGVAETLRKKLNDAGIWHFDQIAAWTPANVAWFETTFQGMKGRIERDRWIEQCAKLKDGWRPDSNIGERPKG